MSDPLARKMTNGVRTNLVSYLHYITGNNMSDSRLRDGLLLHSFTGKTHPSVTKAAIICKKYFARLVL